VTEETEVPAADAEIDDYVARYFAKYLDIDARDAWSTDHEPLSEVVYQLIQDGKVKEAWSIVLALVNAAPSSAALGFVAADTLELLMRYPTTTAIHHEMVEEATTNARLREAFGLVYWYGGEPDWFRQEIAAPGVATG
jgi:hypothetical protein